MFFTKMNISRFLLKTSILLAIFMLSSCLDVPSDPNTKSKIEDVSIKLVHKNRTDSVLFKITPDETAKIKAEVTPNKYKDDLHYHWYQNTFDNENNIIQSLVSEERSFEINSNKNPEKIPNALMIDDDEGNYIIKVFSIIVNSPPEIDKKIIPAKGDTLQGDTNTAFLFQWKSSDKDNESITHTIIIDKNKFDVGTLSSIRQSGFQPGKHTFQIFATDSFGDTDKTDTIVFYVKDF